MYYQIIMINLRCNMNQSHNQCMEVKSIQGLMEGLSLVIDGNRGTGKAVTLEMTKIYSNGEEDKIVVLWTYFCNRFSMG